jgi:hypothetical protein
MDEDVRGHLSVFLYGEAEAANLERLLDCTFVSVNLRAGNGAADVRITGACSRLPACARGLTQARKHSSGA